MNLSILNNNITNIISPEGYINQLSGTLSKNTRKAYLSDIRQFFKVKSISDITEFMIRSVTVDDVNMYAEDLFNAGLTNATINRKLQSLSKLYNLLTRRDIKMVEYNPFDTKEGANRLQTKDYSNDRELEDSELQAMVEVAKQDTSISGLRNLIILYMLISTGMRREEIANLTIGQISRTQGSYIIEFTGKGRKDRFVVIAQPIKDLIDKYLELRGVSYQDKNIPLFIGHSNNSNPLKCVTPETIYQMIKALASRAGVEGSNISPHTFRHTYITKSLGLGCDIHTVQDRVGHSDVKTTRRYDHTMRILKDNPAEEMLNQFI